MEQNVIKEAVFENIKQRRSTRSYLPKAVPDDIAEQIVEAGRFAPSGMNTQATSFYVISNAGKLTELVETLSRVLANTPVSEGMPPVFVSLINRAKEETVDVIYGAPLLIVTTSKKGAPHAAADTSCALENMMLMATASGLGSCWINQFFHMREAAPIREFFSGIGVPDDEEICGSLAVGYSENIETAPLPRTGYKVKYVK